MSTSQSTLKCNSNGGSRHATHHASRATTRVRHVTHPVGNGRSQKEATRGTKSEQTSDVSGTTRFTPGARWSQAVRLRDSTLLRTPVDAAARNWRRTWSQCERV